MSFPPNGSASYYTLLFFITRPGVSKGRHTLYAFIISPAKEIYYSFPKNEDEFRRFDYDWFCGSQKLAEGITAAEFDTLRTQEKIEIIDVREPGELPSVSEFVFTQIPLSKFEEAITDISTKNKMVVFCQTGKRSLAALKMLTEKFPECVAYSLKGGVEAWKKYYHKT